MLDLHCHSTASDGVYTPEELAVVGYEKHLTALALTDHDTLDGIERFFARVNELADILGRRPFLPVAGIEFSTFNVDGQRMHLVGLFIDPSNSALQQAARQNVVWRDERNHEILEKLAAHGMPLTLEEARQHCSGNVLGRPHIAAAMTAKGYCANPQEAFTKFLGTNCLCYAKRQTLPMAECIELIHRASGLAIWGHPYSRANLTYAHFCELLGRLYLLGLDGAEAYHPAHSQTQTTNVIRAVRERGMLCSGGSDSHGPRFVDQLVGEGNGLMKMPDSLLKPMLERREKYAKS